MKNLNKLFLFLMLLTASVVFAKVKAESIADNGINWTNIDNATSKVKADNRKFILVELYTDWCGWCKKMDENTFEEESIIQSINTNFVAVKFNAETPLPVTFNGKSYAFVKTGARGANQLALDLGSVGGKLGYPTIVILDANGNKLQAFPGYKDIETMSVILKYYESGSYKPMAFQQFQSGQ